MFSLEKIFNTKKNPLSLSPQEAAELLKTTPEALASFEKAYGNAVPDASDEDAGFFDTFDKKRYEKAFIEDNKNLDDESERIARQIAAELAAKTPVLILKDGKVTAKTPDKNRLIGTKPVKPDDLKKLPVQARPQLTATCAACDLGGIPTGDALLFDYANYLKASDQKERMQWYHMFRQGLDILDLDALSYAMCGTNPNSMGKWLPPLYEAVYGQKNRFFSVPDTVIAKVPLTLMQMTRLDYGSLTPATKRVANLWAKEVFCTEDMGDYFVKTGTYSSKFDFRNAHVHGAETADIGEYLLFIQHTAAEMASPLNSPCIYGVSTTDEFAVRQFIKDGLGLPTIYQGLPLRTEYRVFADFDTDEVLSVANYWDPAVMEKRFSQGSDADSPHMKHDYVTYLARKDALLAEFDANKGKVAEETGRLLPDVKLSGQWSIDIMQEGKDFYLIDMALAESSAYYDTVPEAKRRRTPENWLPEIPDTVLIGGA